MKDEILLANKKIGEEFLKKIDEYKEKNSLSYDEIAEKSEIKAQCFNNLRYRIKKNGILPSKKILDKLEKNGII